MTKINFHIEQYFLGNKHFVINILILTKNIIKMSLNVIRLSTDTLSTENIPYSIAKNFPTSTLE